MMTLTSYKKFVRSFELEEPLDYFLYRPLAYLLLKLIVPLPLRPNHISFLALSISIFCSVTLSLSQGSESAAIMCGFGILIFNVLDCCDGMLARITPNNGKYGELVDMFVDTLSSIGLFIAVSFSYRDAYSFWLSLMAFGSLLIHAGLYNFYKKQFNFYDNQNPLGRIKEIEKYRLELEELKKVKGNYFDKLMLWLFLVFCGVQKNKDKIKTYDVNKYLKYNKPMLPLWAAIAGSTHLTVLAISLILNQIVLYFFFAIFIANAWLCFVLLLQSRIYQKMS